MKLMFSKLVMIFFCFSMILTFKHDNSNTNSLHSDKRELSSTSEIEETQQKSVVMSPTVNKDQTNVENFNQNSKNHKAQHMRKYHKKKHHEHNEDNIMEISVYLFVPLVIFILIATVASIAGFLYLVFNYSTATSGFDDKRNLHSKKDLQDLITILRLKNQVAKKKKKGKHQSNYRQEPESEGKVLNL